jgi:hypothetical protein
MSLVFFSDSQCSGSKQHGNSGSVRLSTEPYTHTLAHRSVFAYVNLSPCLSIYEILTYKSSIRITWWLLRIREEYFFIIWTYFNIEIKIYLIHTLVHPPTHPSVCCNCHSLCSLLIRPQSLCSSLIIRRLHLSLPLPTSALHTPPVALVCPCIAAVALIDMQMPSPGAWEGLRTKYLDCFQDQTSHYTEFQNPSLNFASGLLYQWECTINCVTFLSLTRRNVLTFFLYSRLTSIFTVSFQSRTHDVYLCKFSLYFP